MQRKVGLKIFLIFCFLSLISISNIFAASGWEEIFQNLSISDRITPGVQQTTTLYNGTAIFTITDGDNIANNFTDADRINFQVEGSGVRLNFAGDRSQLIEWAKANSSDLLKAIFGTGPEVSFGGMTNTQYNTQQLFTTIYSSPEHSGVSFVPISNKDIAIKGQYDFMEIGKEKADAKGSSGLLAYDHKFGLDRNNSIGIVIPYRQVGIDDELDSKYKFVAFMPFYKHRWYINSSVVEWLLNLALSVTYLESSLFPDGGGYFEYGGGTGVRYGYAFSPQLSVNAGLSYQGLKRNIPSNLVPGELRWVSDAINNLSFEHDLIPSLGVFYYILPDQLSFRGELFRIHQLQSDVVSDYKYQTVALGVFTYTFSKRTKLSLGYKRSFEMKDITDQSIIATLNRGW